ISNGLCIAEAWSVATSEFNPRKIAAGLQDCGTILYDDSTKKWMTISGGDGMEVAFDPRNDSVMYYNDGNNNILSRSGNGGRKWKFISPRGEVGAYTKPFLIDPKNPDILYTGFHDVFQSTDKGNSWAKISDFSSVNKSDRLVSIAICVSDTEVMYAGFPNPTWSDTMANKLFRTGDGGKTWEDITNGLIGAKYSSLVCVGVKPDNPDDVYDG